AEVLAARSLARAVRVDPLAVAEHDVGLGEQRCQGRERLAALGDVGKDIAHAEHRDASVNCHVASSAQVQKAKNGVSFSPWRRMSKRSPSPSCDAISRWRSSGGT